ncbi:MAG: heme-binding protein [Betaproteobacteria bacterium]
MSQLNLQAANKIIDKALAKAREMGVKPLAVVVIDGSGNMVAAQRDDGASMFRIDVGLGKAWASVAMGASSRALAKRAKDNPNFFLTLAATAQGKFLPQPGGVLIRDAKGAIIGAAGASGGTGEEDEAACVFGIEQAGLVADAAG